MNVPDGRGPVSRAVATGLRTGAPVGRVDEPLPQPLGEDAQLALWMLFELHYRGFDDAVGDREWDPDLIALRGELEGRMEAALRRATTEALAAVPDSGDVVDDLTTLLAADTGPSVAAYVHRHASREQVLDLLAERSLYALKESDGHSFVVGRLEGGVKAALAEVQYDEYGGGRPDRLHATLYAEALDAAGLDPTYGAYLPQIGAETLAGNNLHSVLAFRHRLRAAAMGHLAAFESTSSIPSRRIAAGIERVGLPAATAAYFHEHVEADAVHEQVVLRDICGGLVTQDPAMRDEILFGAAACLHLDALAGKSLLRRWAADDHERAAS